MVRNAAKAEPQPASVEIKEQILKEGWGQRGGKGLLKTNHRLKFCSVYVFIYIAVLRLGHHHIENYIFHPMVLHLSLRHILHLDLAKRHWHFLREQAPR